MTWRIGLLLVLLLVLASAGSWLLGHQAGLADGRAICAEAQTSTYRSVLDESMAQLKNTQDVSTSIFQRLAQRDDRDQQTSRELRHVLAETAADRAACRFPAGVMQQLEAARQRATQATTSGLSTTLPSSGGSGG